MLEQFATETKNLLALPDPDTGEAPKSRIGSADAIRGLWASFERDDRLGSYNRGRVRELLNGAPPYDQASREEEGQGELFNINTGHGRLIVDAATSGVMDIFTSDRNLLCIPLSKRVPESIRTQAQRCLEDRFSEMLKDWECFMPRITNLCYAFVADGIGVVFFENDKTWQIGSASLSEIRFPSRCEPVSSKIPFAIMKKTLHVGELWRKIENEDAGENEGWDRDEVIKVIHQQGRASNHNEWQNWEKMLEDIKANEAHVSNTINPIEILYCFCEEVDGKVSLYTCGANDGGILQKKERMYDSMNEVFQVFPYGVGENNRLYTVRGMGYFIYQSANAENILQSIFLNAAKVGALPQYQVTGTESLDDAAFYDLGHAQLIPPGLALIDQSQKRDLRSTLVPAMDLIENSLTRTSGGLGETTTFKERANEDNISASLEQLNKMNSFAITLFYPPLDRVFREMVKRVFKDNADTPESEEMKRLLIEDDGIPEEVFKEILFDKVRASRVLGGGNKANRINTLKDIRENTYGDMDAQGRKDNSYDYVLERAGKDYADRYIGKPSVTRTTADHALAELENFHLLDGDIIEPKDGQDHLVHIRIHLEALGETVDMVEQGQLDLVEYTLRNLPLYEHVQKTLGMIVPHPIIEKEVKEYVRQVQNLKGFFDNGMKAAAKQEAEQGAMNAQGDQADANAQKIQREEAMKVEAFQRDQQRKDQETQANIERKNAETAAKIAQADSLNASKIRKA